jgi:hypothetical protein
LHQWQIRQFVLFVKVEQELAQPGENGGETPDGGLSSNPEAHIQRRIEVFRTFEQTPSQKEMERQTRQGTNFASKPILQCHTIHGLVWMVKAVAPQGEGHFVRAQPEIFCDCLQLQFCVLEVAPIQKTHFEQFIRGLAA